jgi:hypothetical protein
MEREMPWMLGRTLSIFGNVSSIPARIPAPAVFPDPRDERRNVDICRSVLRRMFAAHRAICGESTRSVFFILHSGPYAPSDSDLRTAGRQILSDPVRQAISRGLSDLPMRIVWVDDCYGVGGNPDGEYIPDGGAVVRFRGIRYDAAGLAFVEGSIHRWGLSPLGFEYVVEKKAGFWTVKSSYHKWMC